MKCVRKSVIPVTLLTYSIYVVFQAVGGRELKLKENIIDIQTLETIFNSMVRAMDHSKNDIFIISEQSRQSFEDMQKELATVKVDISRAITEGDYLEEYDSPFTQTSCRLFRRTS